MQQPTRHLRPPVTATLTPAGTWALWLAIKGPSGLLAYPPRSPALTPPVRPLPRLTVAPAGVPIAVGGLLLLSLWAVQRNPPPANMPGAVAPLPSATSAGLPSPAPPAPPSATVVVALPTATAILVAPLVAPLPTILPTLAPPRPTATDRPAPPVRWIPPATLPPIPPPLVPTAIPMPPSSSAGPGNGGNDWSPSIAARGATIHAEPTP